MTPMMLQYMEIKNKYPDHILFFRLGDFYEMFHEDARIASRELDLVLTGRDCGEEKRADMCGIPYHSYENYVKKLVEKGYKIAICEQLEPPKPGKDLVKREVIKVITPGTVTEDTLLDSKSNNFLSAVYINGTSAAIAFLDIADGRIFATSAGAENFADTASNLINEMASYLPSELLINVNISVLPELERYVTGFLKCAVAEHDNLFDVSASERAIMGESACRDTLPPTDEALRRAVGALLLYLDETQLKNRQQIKELCLYDESMYLAVEAASRRGLELCETMRGREKKGSVLSVLDHTKTAVGARLLKRWLEKPLMSCTAIRERQDAVEYMASDALMRDAVMKILCDTADLERTVMRITCANASARDLKAVEKTLKLFLEAGELIYAAPAGKLRRIYESVYLNNKDTIEYIISLIGESIKEDPLFVVREGGMIKDGYNAQVDEFRAILRDGKEYLKTIESAERELTGIKNLKIAYNKVFGHYIEVTNSYLSLVPDRYIRKQTLVGGERFITEELKDIEAKILGAGDGVKALEYELFMEILHKVASFEPLIRSVSDAISQIDVFASLAKAACDYNYVRPVVDTGDELILKDARHPVVERVLENFFVPNDTALDLKDNKVMIITGPNMAGKSTYMRQVAIITLMAQMGSFVPASYAKIGVVDKIFTRIGASDDLASGQSTFMLEMTEVAYILKNATKRSLILYDEIGRGTSTFDGMSIAKAIAEYTARTIGARTMFATHYHELSSLEKEIEGTKNYNIAAKKKGDTITFLRKIVPGAADDSYGIEVAKLAGVPDDVISRAKLNLRSLENDAPKKIDTSALPVADDSEIIKALRMIDINDTTPFEALSLLAGLVKMLDE